VYCPNCGARQLFDFRFCSKCGMKMSNLDELEESDRPEVMGDPSHDRLLDAHDQPIPAMSPEAESPSDEVIPLQAMVKETVTSNEPPLTAKLPLLTQQYLWLVIPIFSMILASGSIGGLYYYEVSKNQKVETHRKHAETDAFKRNYEKALTHLNQAIQLRGNNPLLKKEKAKVETALLIQNDLKTVNQLSTEKKYNEASQKLAQLEETLFKEQGKLFAPFYKEVKDAEDGITVGKMELEIKGLQSVDELANRLAVLEKIPTAPAVKVQKQMIAKIVELTTAEVTAILKNKDFQGAFAAVDKGLSFVDKEPKLIALKERIKAEKEKFEREQQERLEKAMAEAAKEDLFNRTQAIDLLNLEVEHDYYGNLYVYGNVKNVSKIGISSIRIYYSVYNSYGDYLGERNVLVTPSFLSPGQTGYYEDIIYGLDISVQVEIDDITWVLN
jgi:hypothetical protein